MQLEQHPLTGFLLKLIHLHNLEHMKGAFFQWRPEGHHVAACRSEWQQRTTSSTSFSTTFGQLASILDLRAIIHAIGVIWPRPQANWLPGVL